MPDHLHFFCASNETTDAASLSRFIGGFKQWTAKGVLRAIGGPPPLWQREFFDHVLRSTSQNGNMCARTPSEPGW